MALAWVRSSSAALSSWGLPKAWRSRARPTSAWATVRGGAGRAPAPPPPGPAPPGPPPRRPPGRGRASPRGGAAPGGGAGGLERRRAVAGAAPVGRQCGVLGPAAVGAAAPGAGLLDQRRGLAPAAPPGPGQDPPQLRTGHGDAPDELLVVRRRLRQP